MFLARECLQAHGGAKELKVTIPILQCHHCIATCLRVMQIPHHKGNNNIEVSLLDGLNLSRSHNNKMSKQIKYCVSKGQIQNSLTILYYTPLMSTYLRTKCNFTSSYIQFIESALSSFKENNITILTSEIFNENPVLQVANLKARILL